MLDISYLIKVFPNGSKPDPTDVFSNDEFCNIGDKKCEFKVKKPGKYDVYLVLTVEGSKKLKDLTPVTVTAKSKIKVKIDSEITSIVVDDKTFYKLTTTINGG